METSHPPDSIPAEVSAEADKPLGGESDSAANAVPASEPDSKGNEAPSTTSPPDDEHVATEGTHDEPNEHRADEPVAAQEEKGEDPVDTAHISQTQEAEEPVVQAPVVDDLSQSVDETPLSESQVNEHAEVPDTEAGVPDVPPAKSEEGNHGAENGLAGQAVDGPAEFGFEAEAAPEIHGDSDPVEALKRSPPTHTSSFPPVPHPVDADQQKEDAAGTANDDNPFGSSADFEDDFFGSNGNVGNQNHVQPAESSDFFSKDVEDDFFGSGGPTSGQNHVQPTEPNDLFSKEADDDFFSSPQNNVQEQHVKRVDSFLNDNGLNRSHTADIVMGGDPEPTEPDRYAEGMPLFGPEETTEDDFFSQTRTTIENDEESSFFDNNPVALARKSTMMVAGPLISEEKEQEAKEEKTAAPANDLAARWGAVLDDDEFLDDDEEGGAGDGLGGDTGSKPGAFDPSGFFQDDGEGFLSDEEDTQAAPVPTATTTAPAPAPISAGNAYVPANRYAPSPAIVPSLTSPPAMSPYQAAFNRASQPPQPEVKAQSFLAQAGGYHSPYDLPDDIVKPIRRRTSQPPPQHVPHPSQQHGGHNPSHSEPPRGREGFGISQPPPLPPKSGLVSPPATYTPVTGPPAAAKPKPPAQQAQFFEELPTIPIKPRSGSTARYGPNQRAPPGGFVPPDRHSSVGPGPNGRTPSIGAAPGVRSSSIGAPPLRPPSIDQGKYSPVAASALAGATQQHSAAASAYAPAPASSAYAPRPAAGGLHAAPPAAQRSVSPYAPRPAGVGVLQNTSGTPRDSGPPSGDSFTTPGFPGDASDTSSTKEYGRPSSQDRPSSRDRPPSRDRPGTMESLTRGRGGSLGEVAEEDEEGRSNVAGVPNHAPPPPWAPSQSFSSRYAPSSRSSASTPPPPFGSSLPSKSKLASPPPAGSSPSKYTPATTASTGYPTPVSSHSAADGQFAPPRRSQTQSPGVAAMRTSIQAREPYQRPSSAAASHLPYGGAAAPAQYSNDVRQRHQSYPSHAVQAPSLPFVPPHPDSAAAQDPLQRWKGCPVFCWGFGGSVVTMFPARTQRWNAESREQMIKSSPGEVKLKQAKDTMGDDSFLAEAATFPGPLNISKGGNKTKKKELVMWMEERIKAFESLAAGTEPYLHNRMEEKVLLWKLVKVCLENDGVLFGTKEIEKVVRDILNPNAESQQSNFTLPTAPAMPHPLDPEAIKSIRAHLLRGDRESAVWYGIENNQWAHAMLIASTVSPDLFKRTVQEFVRQEVKSATGKGSESLAVLYEVFAGNTEEAIDDLVPPSARMGMTMMSTTGSSGSESTMLERLNLWRETLGLILSNRSNGDADAIFRLGKLLESYGRVEAAHTCYIFAHPLSIFGGAEETQTSFSLLGGDHISNPFNYGRDMDAVILSEIYEYSLSLPKTSLGVVIPHLQSFKLQHALLLAQYGYKTEAQKYCEAIAQGLKSVSRSPYFNVAFMDKLDDLNKRLALTPKDSSGSWISRPSLDTLSGSMWTKFNKFVAGDEDTGKPAGNGTEAESGPFAKLAGNTPGISRSHSPSNSFGGYQPVMHNNPGGMYETGPYAPANKTAGYQAAGRYDPNHGTVASAGAGRYAPRGNAGAPGAHTDAYAPQYSSSPHTLGMDQGRGSMEQNRYAPSPAGGAGYEPHQPAYPGSSAPSYEPHNANPYGPTHVPNSTSAAAPDMYNPSSMPTFGNLTDRPSFNAGESQSSAHGNATDEAQNQGYTPYGYEPPAAEFQPYVPSPDASDDEGGKKSKPKKSSFMDDVGDDDPAAAAAAKRKKEEEENQKMVAEIAEREKKEAEAAKQAKNGGGWFGGWFGGGKKDKEMPRVYKAKLGEESSFYYDPDLKKWVNKNAKPEDSAAAGAVGTPPPPKRISSPASMPSTPSLPGAPPPSAARGGAAGPPPGPSPSAPPAAASGGLMPPPAGLGPPGSAGTTPAGSRGPSPAPPPPRPATTGKMDEMEELLGGSPAGGARSKAGAKAKGRKRYVEVL